MIRLTERPLYMSGSVTLSERLVSPAVPCETSYPSAFAASKNVSARV